MKSGSSTNTTTYATASWKTRPTRRLIPRRYPSHLYPEADIDILIRDILAERMRRINVWGESRYTSFRKKNIRDNANAKGFWAQAVPLKL